MSADLNRLRQNPLKRGTVRGICRIPGASRPPGI
jgi:hypothetical protein